MNWKQEAIEKLRRYDAMKKAVVNLPEEISRLEIASMSIRSVKPDAIHVKGGGGGQEDVMLSNMVHRQELQFAFEQAKSWVKSTDQALGALTPEERLVLTRFYIYPEKGNVDRLCGELGVEQSSVYRRRDAALRKFTVALYGFLETQYVAKSSE